MEPTRGRVCAYLVAHCLAGQLAACSSDTPPSNPNAPPGAPKKLDTTMLEKGAEALQDLSPVRALEYYLDGFHIMKDDPTLMMEAHHYCKGMNEDFTQCAIFDGNTADSNLVGIEYIVSEQLFASLPPEDQRNWHPHNYEILSGQLILPGVPAPAEKAALAKKLNSYGKTWHVWDTGHHGHPAANDLPIDPPRLAWSFNRDGEMPEAMLQARDRRLGVDTAEKRRQRTELATGARPQRGVDDLKP